MRADSASSITGRYVGEIGKSKQLVAYGDLDVAHCTICTESGCFSKRIIRFKDVLKDGEELKTYFSCRVFQLFCASMGIHLIETSSWRNKKALPSKSL